MAETKGKHEVVRVNATPSLSADGIVDTLINANTTKVTFFNVEEPQQGDTPEKRRVVFSVTIPTLAFLEYMVNMRKSLAENRGMLENGVSESAAKIRNFLDDIKGANESGDNKKRAKKH